jgi:YD repeat-containing protein
MKKVLLPIIFLALIASCKKEDAPAPQNILDKVVTKEGADSIVTTYTYDAQNRFVGESVNDPINSETYNRSITRDNNGRITKITDAEVSSTPSSSIIDFAYLGATDTKLRNGKTVYVVSNVNVNDSSAYEYNGAQVTKTNHYYSTSNQPYLFIEYYEYTYDARGNMTSVKYYEVDAPGSTNFQLKQTLTFTYDDKINPIYSKDDALVEYFINQYVSPNNMTGLTYSSVSTPSNNFSATFTYEYRSDGRPTKSTLNIGGSSSVSTFTYR